MPERYRHTSELRTRIAAHLATFPRVQQEAGGLRHAAVALTLFGNAAGSACFALTLRASSLRKHAGQFALPGGSLDPGETPQQAARRELHEELGVSLPADAVLGVLDDYPTRSGHLITPVVLWGPDAVRLQPEPSEVAEAYLVPLSHLDRPGNPHQEEVGGAAVLYLSVLDTLVFAPTGAILYQFREVALHNRLQRVADVEQPRFAWT